MNAFLLYVNGFHLTPAIQRAVVTFLLLSLVATVTDSPAWAAALPVRGHKLLIRDDDTQTFKRQIKWDARDVAIFAGAPGSAEDPTCQGNADEVRATIRFFSTGAHDSGIIPLPCQYWTPSTRGYKYKDRAFAASPCNQVQIKRGSNDGRIKARCYGRNLPLSYDLEPGIDEGVVTTQLTLGTASLCTSFDDDRGRDGSDGRRFQGKSAPAPPVCPTPPGNGQLHSFDPTDFDGDGAPDLTLWRPEDGTWLVRTRTGELTTTLGQTGDLPAPGDFDGDHRTDFAVWRPSTGEWHVKTDVTATPFTVTLGSAGDIPVPADYDGDGRTDYAVWKDGVWSVKVDPAATAYSVAVAGGPLSMPVPGDYNSDGATDYAVFDPVDSRWLYKVDADVDHVFAVVFPGGFQGSAIPVPADYDGDGSTDFAVWNGTNGRWDVQPADGGDSYAVIWGRQGDVPIPGFLDADGNVDYVLRRPSDARWCFRTSTEESCNLVMGLSDDLPVGGGDVSDVEDPAIEEPDMWWSYSFDWDPSEGGAAFYALASGLCEGPSPDPACEPTGVCAGCNDCDPATPCDAACTIPICSGCGIPGSCLPCDPDCDPPDCPGDPRCDEPTCPGHPLCPPEEPAGAGAASGISTAGVGDLAKLPDQMSNVVTKSRRTAKKAIRQIKRYLRNAGYEHPDVTFATRLINVGFAGNVRLDALTTMVAVHVDQGPGTCLYARPGLDLNIVVTADPQVALASPVRVEVMSTFDAAQALATFSTLESAWGDVLEGIRSTIGGVTITAGAQTLPNAALANRAINLAARLANLGAGALATARLSKVNWWLNAGAATWAGREFTSEALPLLIQNGTMNACLDAGLSCDYQGFLTTNSVFASLFNGRNPKEERRLKEVFEPLGCADCGFTCSGHTGFCSCDPSCLEPGGPECCDDACDRCPAACSCAQRGCGAPTPPMGCRCDSACAREGNCCPDACEICDACNCRTSPSAGCSGFTGAIGTGCGCHNDCGDNCCSDACSFCGSGPGCSVFDPQTDCNCNDENPCTADVCDVDQGCISIPDACDDGDPCTTEVCDPVLGCTVTSARGAPECVASWLPAITSIVLGD